ncbi:hypothetical protein [Streptomyces sp. NPDC001296]
MLGHDGGLRHHGTTRDAPMIPSETVRRLERALRGAAGALSVLDRTAEVLLDAVPADVWCAVILDPATLLDTGGQHAHGFPEGSMLRLFEIEHVEQDDVDDLRALTRRSGAAGVRSRRELVGELFLRHCLPQLAHPPPAPDGRLLSDPPPPPRA